MILKSSRSLVEMREVMLDPSTSSGPDPVYQVFTDLTDHFWINKTVIPAGKIGKEFPKTMGHYHQVDVDEIYYVAAGQGILILQNDEEIFFVKAEVGDEVTIKSEFGHNWSNVGSKELILFDNWSVPHSPTDYAWVEIEHGMAYYLIEENGEIKTVPNPHYVKLPKASWLTAKEFNARS